MREVRLGWVRVKLNWVTLGYQVKLGACEERRESEKGEWLGFVRERKEGYFEVALFAEKYWMF